jgi:hypothetical protein
LPQNGLCFEDLCLGESHADEKAYEENNEKACGKDHKKAHEEGDRPCYCEQCEAGG